MKKYLLIFAAAVAALAICSCNKEPKPGKDEGPDLEKVASEVKGLQVIETTLAVDPDGFNMLTDGGFEREDWDTHTLFWHPYGIELSEEPCTGNHSIRFYKDGEGWEDLAVQTINVKKGQSYTLTLKYRGAWKGLNCYMGFRAAEGHDVNTNDSNRNDAWDDGYSYTWENVDDTEATAFFGGWWWYDLWVELDDMRVIPTGSSNDTYMPVSAKVPADSTVPVADESFEMNLPDRAVFASSGNVGMIHKDNATTGDAVENVFVTTGNNKNGDLVIAASTPTEIKNFIPDAAIGIGNEAYVHGVVGYDPGVKATSYVAASCEEACILKTDDGGKTWNKSIVFEGESKFAKACFAQKDNTVYIFGSVIDNLQVYTYLAKVEASKLGNKADWEYWDGGEFAKGTEEIAASIFYGPTDLMSVTYNAEKYTWMMVYRSFTTGQLVYRDAGLPEGEWSGEKLLVANPAGTELYAPQVVSNKGDKMKLITSKLTFSKAQ